MKEVIMEPEFRERLDLVKLVQEAIPLVDDLLGKPASRVTAIFDLQSDDRGKPRVRLSISDDLAGKAKFGSDFPIDMFRSPDAVAGKILGVWRGLMNERLEENLEKLKASVATE